MTETPEGYCRCGCGGIPTVADRTDPAKGWVKGQRHKYLVGHHSKPQGNPVLVIPETGCWEWQFGKTSAGYGCVYTNGKAKYAHIWMWECVNGPVPEGLELDHKCRNRCCCNPDHLEPVTHAENIRRGKSTLTQTNVNDIRARRERGETVSLLAETFQVSTSSIRRIVKGTRWATQ